ncbi:hypothetical protein [Pseudobacteroides cellulosolvens]|uniref:Uncharacterized protein n=1 Tax=Pseudobacteroides cellulosolvens ATCC 35603 = DSM 2933 TaxID=398512 RepID=A0A0L6JGK6_9FIRM|nr:hypothetical protein [Pseudobacteroides cellulosolvens]KNY24825.1 hypothetical protein Bccel_0082 [Pseudobacteroides cellulosolvens ATCC 35603 = DSM 2933]
MKIDINTRFGIEIIVNKDEKQKMLNDFIGVYKKAVPFLKWYKDPARTKAEKDKYRQQNKNATWSITWAYKILKIAGYTDDELKKQLKV